MSSFTFEQLIKIEHTTQRVIRTVMNLTDKETSEQLQKAMYILAEIRFASEFLQEPDGQYKKEATERLLTLFQEIS